MPRTHFQQVAAALLVTLGAAADSGRDAVPLPAPGPADGGWIESARGSVAPGSWISEMHATFVVPSAPRYSGQLLYFFPGLQPAVPDTIIQPVLRYSADGWSMVSVRWQRDNVTESEVVATAPGHKILGTMRSSSCTSAGMCTWTITTADLTSGESTRLTEHDSTAYTWYFAGVVEAYGMRNCGQYPPDGFIRFQDVVVLDQDGDELPVAPHERIDPGATPDCGFGLSRAPLSSAPAKSVVTLFFDKGCPGGC